MWCWAWGRVLHQFPVNARKRIRSGQIYIGTFLQSNILEVQEVRSREAALGSTGKPHHILRHNLQRIGQLSRMRVA